MYTSSQLSFTNCKKTRAKKSALSLGLALPFHPCMQDEKTMENILKHSEERVHVMLGRNLDSVYADDMFARLKDVFNKLNYNSHCKSIAVLLTVDEERVAYLNFPVKPVTYLNKYVSLLELTANGDRQPYFYFLVLELSHAKLYEYHHNRLNQVYVTKQENTSNEKTNCESIFKQVLQTLDRLSGNNEKPVFITGSSNLAELFCNSSCYSGTSFRLLDNAAPFSKEGVKRLVKEIISQWNYWQLKFIIDRIMIAKKANALIAEIEAVLQALSRGVDGLLLIDKGLKQQLYKSRRTNALFNTDDELMNQVERFLKRGNRIEITETGLLKEFGEIVLLQYKIPQIITLSPVCNSVKYNRPDTF